MYYIYFPYVCILSLLLLFEFIDKDESKISALVVFFAPVTAPYYIFKTRKEEGITLIMVFIASFSAVVAGEIALYAHNNEKLKYSNQPPVVRQALVLADELQKTTEEFDETIIRLEEMGRIVSGLGKIQETIDYIDVVRQAGNRNKEMLSQLTNYIENYRSYYSKKNVTWIFMIGEFYDNEVVRLHLESLDQYLDAFESLLVFSYKNFYKIEEIGDPKALKNYDAYYLNYRRAAEKFSKYNSHRTDYQTAFVREHPEIESYLPGVRQTDVFNIHRQSSRRFF